MTLPAQKTTISENWFTWLSHSNRPEAQCEVPFKVTLPHHWGKVEHGEASYLNYLQVQRDLDKTYFLCLDGICGIISVWFNGEHLGRFTPSQAPLSIELTYLMENGNNTLFLTIEHPKGEPPCLLGLTCPIELEVKKSNY